MCDLTCFQTWFHQGTRTENKFQFSYMQTKDNLQHCEIEEPNHYPLINHCVCLFCCCLHKHCFQQHMFLVNTKSLKQKHDVSNRKDVIYLFLVSTFFSKCKQLCGFFSKACWVQPIWYVFSIGYIVFCFKLTRFLLEKTHNFSFNYSFQFTNIIFWGNTQKTVRATVYGR